MSLRMRAVVFLAAALLPANAPATTYTVRPDGTGDFPTIQAAIDAAVHGDVIELTNGTFRGPGNRDIDYRGKAITVRSQSGSPEACVIDCEGRPSEPHRGFHFDGDGEGGVLDGVTVTNGYRSDGGAVWIMMSSPAIRHCIFRQNQASGSGGGVYCDMLSGATFFQCTFDGNVARAGGGFCI